MYSDCNDLESAKTLFVKLPQPNVFAWTSLLSFYSRNGMSKQCLQTYIQMTANGVSPDKYVFPKILRACAQSFCLYTGFQIHKHIITTGEESNLQICNSLIDTYSKCGDVLSARCVFENIAVPDLLSWNSMISGYVSNGFPRFALEMFGEMRLKCLNPDIVTLNSVMDAYCRMGLCDEAHKIFEQIDEPNIISWTTLMSGFSRVGKHEVSLSTFRKMMERTEIFPDFDSLSSIIVSCRHLGDLRKGKEIHGYGVKVETNSQFYSSAGAALLTMYGKCGKKQYMKNLFKLMDKRDVVTWNSMILGFSNQEMGNSALVCFSEMQKRGIKSDQITFSTLLPLCDLKSGKQIHAYIQKGRSFDFAVPVWNSLIYMYQRCGYIKSAYSVFSSMLNKDLISYNTMIGGLGMHGHGEAALQLLHEMMLSNISPNSVTFTSVLSACSHSGLINEGLELFLSLDNEFRFTPKMEHFACAVDILARAGRLNEAIGFIQRMPLLPDKRVWGSLLAACRAYQNVTVGKLAAEHLLELEPDHAGHYVTLSNIYARDGRWEDAVRVRKLMEGRGLVKPSGYSWIESRNKAPIGF